MPETLVSILATALEKAALGAADPDIVGLIASAQATPALSASGPEIERLSLQLTSVVEAIRDRGVSERGLSLLIDTTHDLSNTLSLQGLLRTVVSRARSLVGANVAWLTLLDEQSGSLNTVTAEGHLASATSEMTTRVGYGAVSLVIASKAFFDTQNYLGDHRFRHSEALDRVFKAENIVSLAGLPILSDNKLQGILFVADRYRRKLSGREISVLGSLAAHAGVAMRNARSFAMLTEALAEAERNRAALIDHIHRVDVSAAAHDAMASLLAEGAEWPLFVQRMADQFDAAITLHDDALVARRRFTSASYAGGSDERSDDLSLLADAVSQSRRSGRSVAMLETGGEHFRAMALHGGSGRGESLMIRYRGDRDPIDIRNMERSAVALSIAKLWGEKREAEHLINSSTLLRHLILVDPPDPATALAVRNRLNTDEPLTLALISISGLDRASQTAIVREAAANMNLLVDLLDDTYLAAGPQKTVRALLQALTRRRKTWAIGGIVSDPFADLTEAPAHYGRIDRALKILRKMERLDGFIDHARVSLFAKLFEVGDAARIGRYVLDILAPIDARDPDRRRQLKKTLLCYIDCQHNLARAAERLGLHVNTVRQRLDTLRDITGGWDDPVSALELHVALRLDAIAAPP